MAIPYKSKSYALHRYGKRLHYIEKFRPKIYEEIAEDGTCLGSSYKKPDEWQLKRLKKKGITIREADIDKEINYLKERIASIINEEE